MDLNHYRPIAQKQYFCKGWKNPTFAKIFGSAMSQRIYSFCEKYNVLDRANIDLGKVDQRN